MEFLSDLFDAAQQWLFEQVFQPALFNLGLARYLEDAYLAAGWFLVGCLQILVITVVLVPLQRWRPVEPVTDRHAIRIDMLYTAIHRLGLFRVALFFGVDPLWDHAVSVLRLHGVQGIQLDAWWPGITDIGWVSLLLYLVVLDFVEYWIHRGQHYFHWWWSLHALHHSQRQMTAWSDDRNHLLDDVIHDSILVIVAVCVGVAPSQFIAIVALSQLSQSLQHANLRLGYGRWGTLWISPCFHRRHHAIGIGHEAGPAVLTNQGTITQGTQGHAWPYRQDAAHTSSARLGGCNFGVLLPWWDMLFKTANFEDRYEPTGIRDQVEPDAQGRLRDYGRGFWDQQWQGILRLFRLR